MSEKASQLRIGIFVIVGVAILLAALFIFGIRSAFQPTYKAETYVTGDVQGLSVGSIVKLRGVDVGKVTEIGFSWSFYGFVQPACVVVRFEVRQAISPEMFRKDFDQALDTVVQQGVRAIVQPQGITGTSILALETLDPKLYPPLKVPWKPKYPYIPSAPSQFGQILASLDRTLSNLQKLDLDGLVASVERTLDSADVVFHNLQKLDVKRISSEAVGTLTSAESAIHEVEGLASDARTTIRNMKLEGLGENANQLLVNVDARLALLLDKLSAIDVRALNDTLAGTREAARSLNEALEDLKRYPSGFLLGPAPAPVPGLQKQEKK
jgi:phospholipid/cholesterol/gamma-HCH transport system substrate-binding protein